MIICLSGWKNSGKDTCANHLIHKYGAKRVALADPLKDAVAEEYGIDRGSLDDRVLKEKPLLNMPVNPKDKFSQTVCDLMVREFRTSEGNIPITPDTHQLYWTPRALCILKASSCRSVSPNYWTNRALKQIQSHGNEMIVITDLRYVSEAKFFKEMFGPEQIKVIRVNRESFSNSTDASERDLDNYEFDHYIHNTGAIEQTHKNLDDLKLPSLSTILNSRNNS